MGYHVTWKGSFQTDCPMAPEHVKELRQYEDSEDWPGATPDVRFNPWLVAKDGEGFEVLTDKPGDWKAWLQYLVDHFLTPWGYKLSGTVEWDGEERGDAGTITIEGGIVKARRRKLAMSWASFSAEMREHIGKRIAHAMSADRWGNENAWLAALDMLGQMPTSDRTVFDE
jgi:hypothetical protein